MTLNEYQLTFVVGTLIFWGTFLISQIVYIFARHGVIAIDIYLFLNTLEIIGIIIGGLIIITNEFGESINRRSNDA